MNTFAITGMTCAGCARKVEATLKSLAPSATVTLEPPRAVLDEPVGEQALNAALAAVGKYRVSAEANTQAVEAAAPTWIKTYYPLLLIVGLIALGAAAGPGWMLNFMGGFFVVFGAFKLLDVPAFANAYARYDVIAKAFKPWGMAYPFVETALGFAFLFRFQIPAMLWVALALSLIGAIGVIQANLNKQTIQCACLGTVFQLPMSVVTIVESLGMAAMAVWMLAV
ncbi:heavy-metal-associated domain-containing protein [Aestuariivirga litoralis]|uniref:heavy-metal-associated domain-containing protein n=1 Tax=Aestuariivirga litoralis TaxID=2650924 RepID=UPI0018C512AC|nr:heavy metal-associated domain-containing protein [Aestuariivirga litoralis]MBG1233687.1 heavy metal translocating P-type ATPase [Aestuariivirga litoralis]